MKSGAFMEQRYIFLSVILTSFFGPFLSSALTVAIPSIASSFEVSAAQLVWLVTLFLLGSAVSLLPAGKLADIYGRRRIYTIGCLGAAVSVMACAFAFNLLFLYIGSFIQGLFFSLVYASCTAILVCSYPQQKRGRILGFFVASVYIGLSAGPLIGGFLTQFCSWRLIFFFTGTGLLWSGFIAMFVKSEWYGKVGEKLDFWSIVLYAFSAAALLCGFASYNSQHFFMRFLVAAGFFGALLFIWRQKKLQEPLLPLLLFKNKIFAFSNLASFINYSATFGITFVLSLFLQLVRGLDAFHAGLLLLVQPVCMALGSPKAGALSDKFNPQCVAAGGMSIISAGLFLFSFVGKDVSCWYVGMLLAIIGIGFSLFASPNNNSIMSAVEPQFFGIASSMLAIVRIFGQSLSMALITCFLAEHAHPGAMLASGLARKMPAIFLTLGIICLFGIFASLAGRKLEAAQKK